MEDIILSDPRQASAQNISRKQKEQKKKGRRLREYFVDLFIKSLLLAVLLSIDFTLFAEAGSYNLFTAEQTLSQEAIWIYIGIVIFSLSIIFLFSFSLTLQNFIIGLGSGFLLLALFAQFALFDSHSILVKYFSSSLTGTMSNILNHYSHMILAVALILIVFIFLTFAKRSTQTYLFGILLLILGGLLSEAYFNPQTRFFDTKTSLGEENSHSNGRNFVLIALQNAPSYYQLSSYNETQKDTSIEQSLNNVLGFYQQNNFTYYPYSYVKNNNNPNLNMVSILNPDNNDNPEQLLLSDVIMNSYWDFKNIGHSKLYLKDNQFFGKFIKDGYNIRAYGGEGIELCTVNSRLSVNRCISRTGLPISFDDLNISPRQKVVVLAAEWLESTGFIRGIDPILGLISAFTREVSPLRFSTKQLKSYNSFKNLDLIAQDISTDKGNNVYITIVDLPGHLFMYDNLCNLKPISEWLSADDKSSVLFQRKISFAEQTSCLYGQLEKFMQKLESSGKLAHTTVVISGLNTPFASIPGVEKDLFKNLQNTKQTGIAIYDPQKDQADIDYSLCTVPGILGKYLSKKNCTELEGFTITEQLKAQIFQEAQKQEIPNKDIEDAKNTFKQWYASWAAYHQVENNMAEEIIPLEKSPDTPEIIPEKEIKAAPATVQAEELAPEAEVKTLSETAAEAAIYEETPQETSVKLQEETKEAAEPAKTMDSNKEFVVTEEKVKETKTEEPKVENTKETFLKEKKEELKEGEKETAQATVQKEKNVEATQEETVKAPVPEKKPAPIQPQTAPKAEPQKQTVSETKPLPKPERLKQEFKKKLATAQTGIVSTKEEGSAKISVEVKVIENTVSNDVTPPALIDDLQEAPKIQE